MELLSAFAKECGCASMADVPDNILQASVLVEDALQQRKEIHLMDRKTLRLYRGIYSQPWFNVLSHLIVLAHLSLAFVEPPGEYTWPQPVQHTTA